MPAGIADVLQMLGYLVQNGIMILIVCILVEVQLDDVLELQWLS